MAVISTNQSLYEGDGQSPDPAGASPGPLLLLRISSLATKNQRPDTSLKLRPYRDSGKVPNSEKIQARVKNIDPGFLFDLDLPQAPSCLAVNEHDPSKNQGLQLATIFLNSSKAYGSKYNVIDPLKSKDQTKGANLLDRARVHMSRSTRERAETVKFCFDLKYLWLERSQEVHAGDPHFHAGVDGVYNPLQTIRDRIVRQKLHQQPNPNNYKTPPLACDAFSTHNIAGKKRWRLIWGIDLNELTFDMAWRKVYWYELRNAQGDLWFPRASDEHRKASERMHDKLWTGPDVFADGPDNALKEKKQKRRTLKERAKRFYANSHNSTSDSDGIDLSFGLPASSDTMSKLKLGHAHGLSTGQSSDRHQFEYSRSTDHVVNPRRNSSRSHSSDDGKAFKPRPPIIIVGHANNESVHSHSNSSKVPTTKTYENTETEQLYSINDVNFSSGHDKSSVIELEYKDEASDFDASAEPEHCDEDERLLSSIKAKSNHLELLVSLDYYYLSVVHPVVLQRIENRVSRIMEKDLRNLGDKVSEINNSMLPSRELLNKAFQDEIRSILRVANEECATKTDNLLTATDRLYGELNTSLMMELRKSSKRIDKANQALFGSLVSSSLVDEENLPIPMAGNYKFLYLALENVIVILLHITWIMVTIINFFIRILKFIFNAVSFFVC